MFVDNEHKQMTKKKNIAFIFARGGSKGIKDKNIYLLNNKPLIAYAIEVAIESKLFDDIVISTDSKKIALLSESYGIKVENFRPDMLANDESPELLSWKYEIERYQEKNSFDTFYCLPCTSPLRNVQDIIGMSEYFNKNSYDLVLGITESTKSPLFNMVEKKPDGSLKKVIESEKKIFRRQDSITYYDITTVCYISTPKYILNTESILDGSIGGFKIPKERSLDIDSYYDIDIANYLISKNDNRK